MSKEQQKYLNYAFYATLVMSGFTNILIFGLKYTVNFLGIAELIAFPVLGFMVKKGNYKASLTLLALFVTDRIVFLVRNGSLLLSGPQGHVGPIPFRVITWGIQTWIFWVCFYGAFLTLKKKHNQ